MTNVLIVEDEDKIVQFLGENLKREGYGVDTCTAYSELDTRVRSKSLNADLVILDRLMQGQDTGELIRAMREAAPALKILVLSAINSSEEKAELLNRGADDYISKPFSFVELMARVKALERRPTSVEASNYCRLGNTVLDLITLQLMVEDRKVSMPNKEFLLLKVLISYPGKIFSKPVLFEKVWDISTDAETNVVEATVNNLRRKLEDAKSDIRIRNMRNVGYWVEA